MLIFSAPQLEQVVTSEPRREPHALTPQLPQLGMQCSGAALLSVQLSQPLLQLLQQCWLPVRA